MTRRTIDRHDVALRLAGGATPGQIAREMNADPKHMADVAREPEVQRLVAEHRREVADRVRSGIIQGATIGVRTLIQAAANEDGTVPWPTRVQAATRLVEAAVGKHVTIDAGPAALDDPNIVSPVDALREQLRVIEARAIEAVEDDTPAEVTADPG